MMGMLTDERRYGNSETKEWNGSDIGCANLVAENVTTQNHVASYTISMGAKILNRYFSSSHAPMSDLN